MRFGLLLFALACPLFFFGQIVIQQADMPGPGDTIRRSNTLNLGYIDVDDTGPGHVWDFSSLSPLVQRVDTFLSVGETPFVYQVFFFLAANMARAEPGFDLVPGFQVTDAFTYFRSTSSSFREVGFGVSFNGIPLPTLYDDPDLVYQFPITTGSVDSSSSSYGFSLPGIGYLGGWRNRKNIADGWGTLTTPYGTFETLRVRTELQQLDSIHIDSLGLGIPLYRESIIYKWFANGMGLPVCEVTDNGITQTITYIDSVRNILSVSTRSLDQHSLVLYPNPASEHLILTGPMIGREAWTLEIIDQTGRPVFSESGLPSKGSVSISLHTRHLPAGLYILLFRTGKEVVTRKLILR